MSKTAPMPVERCEECQELRPSIGSVRLGSITEGYRNLCSRCYNRFAAERMGIPEPETVDFEPITRHDALGKAHTFHFEVHISTGVGLRAFEWVNGAPGGYQFGVFEPPETPVLDAHEALVSKIERGLSQRYLQSTDYPDPRQNHLEMVGSALNGRIHQNEDGLCAVVDGREYTWEELGRLVSGHMGYTFRLECFDCADEPELSPYPERPRPWWLDDIDGGGDDEDGQGRPH